ncbi:MAG: lysozyme [Chlorobiaceae bacterium]|nr:lysozyme [Chlorobiaceae bacterium]
MKISNQGLDLIKRFEGLRLKPYRCPANIPTIGYGSTRYEDGSKVKMTDQPITCERAEALLLGTLGSYEKAVNEMVAVPLEQHQFDALVSFAYNLGAAALKKSTLMKLLNDGDYSGAMGQFMRWTRAGGRVMAGLEARREAEQELFAGITEKKRAIA